jgi:hypothetical protein
MSGNRAGACVWQPCAAPHALRFENMGMRVLSDSCGAAPIAFGQKRAQMSNKLIPK